MVNKIIFYFFSENGKIPDYFYDNVNFLLKVNKNNIKIYLLTNVDVFVENVEVFNISCYSHYNIKAIDYLNPLWKYSLLRFFHIADFMKEKKLKNVFHAELDVLLFSSLNVLRNKFKFDKERISYPMDSSIRGIASLMFIPDYFSLKDFCDFIIEKQKNEIILNDMKYLGLYKNRNILSIEPNNENGFFDCAALGQYLFGTHQNPNVPFINETCYIHYDNYVIKRKDDGYYINGFKAHCLHIHSKKLKAVIENFL